MYEPDNSFALADYLGASPNSTYSAQYLSYGDDDYSSFYAYAGETISINTYSDYTYYDDVDTTVTLYNSYGSQVAFNDDGGAGLDSSLNYYASSSGYYYFNVSGYTDSSTGYYDVSVNVGY